MPVARDNDPDAVLVADVVELLDPHRIVRALDVARRGFVRDPEVQGQHSNWRGGSSRRRALHPENGGREPVLSWTRPKRDVNELDDPSLPRDIGRVVDDGRIRDDRERAERVVSWGGAHHLVVAEQEDPPHFGLGDRLLNRRGELRLGAHPVHEVSKARPVGAPTGRCEADGRLDRLEN